jgi:hypothetical protein
LLSTVVFHFLPTSLLARRLRPDLFQTLAPLHIYLSTLFLPPLPHNGELVPLQQQRLHTANAVYSAPSDLSTQPPHPRSTQDSPQMESDEQQTTSWPVTGVQHLQTSDVLFPC